MAELFEPVMASADVAAAADELDLSLPTQLINSHLVSSLPQLTESSSDSDLIIKSPSNNRSSLTVDKNVFILGVDTKVKVTWDIKEDVGACDWIGLFPSGQTDSSKFLDTKNRGMNGGQTGEILWDLDALSHNFTDDVTRVCFQYYQGSSGLLMTTSPSIDIQNNRAQNEGVLQIIDGSATDKTTRQQKLTVSDVEAENLKKGVFFNPDPYVKITIHPGKLCSHLSHHQRELRTTIEQNTTHPEWNGQVFTMDVVATDVLDFEVKDKFAKSRPTISRFLGKASIAVQRVMDRTVDGPTSFSLDLTRRNPAESVSGTLRFSADVRNIKDISPLVPVKRGKRVYVRKRSLPEESSSQRNSHHMHRFTEPSLPSMLTSGNEEIENAEPEISLYRLSRGRIPDGVEIVSNDQELMNCISPSLASVPSIVCNYNNNHLENSDSHIDETVLPSSDNSAGSEITINSTDSAEQDEAPLSVSDGHISQSLSDEYDGDSEVTVSVTTESIASRVEVRSGADVVAHDGESPSISLEVVEYEDNSLEPPALPPRTYNKAPPIPPRRHSIETPPLPPKIPEKALHRSPLFGKQEIETDTLEPPPPPLPPRTYSPIHMQNESGSSLGSQISVAEDGDSMEVHPGSQESLLSSAIELQSGSECGAVGGKSPEVFPWGSSKNKQLKNLSPKNSDNASVDNDIKISTVGTVSAQLAMLPSIESVVSNVTPNTSPEHINIAQDEFMQTPSILVEEDKEASEGASGTCQDLVLPLRLDTPSRIGDVYKESSAGSPPLIQPRTKKLSNEEKQQNRQQISQNLKVWTHNKQISGSFSVTKPVSDPDSAGDGTTGDSGSETTNSDQTNSAGSVTSVSMSSHSQIVQSGAANSVNDSVSPSSSAVWQLRQTPADNLDTQAGWEARVDSHGRVFYIDHTNRQTTWQKPKSGQKTVQRRQTISSEQRQQLDRRYQSIRRTINQPRLESENSTDNAVSGNSEGSPQTTVHEPSPSSLSAAAPSVSSVAAPSSTPSQGAEVTRTDSINNRRSVYKKPAVKFLSRADFFPLLQQNEVALAEYNKNSTLKHMISKIRRDSLNFERYQHNRDLVTFLNLFADSKKALPGSWEMKLDRSGKPFFIDHTSKLTSFIDPRLPTDVPPINPDFLHTSLFRDQRRPIVDEARSIPTPPPRQPVSEADMVPTAYNEKVVAFLRQATITEILKEKYPKYITNVRLREKITKIRLEGTDALDMMSNDLDLNLLLSLFENEVMSYVPPQTQMPHSSTSTDSPHGSPNVQRANVRVQAAYKRDFQAKLRNFYRKLDSKGYGQGPSKLKLIVRRDHVLEDSFNKVMSTPKKELQKSKLYITFAGEEGLDYGGPSREFFFLLSRELFNPYYGLFEYSANDTYTVQVSSMSAFVEDGHEWFRFAGRVLGLALIHQYLLDAFFTRPFYKALLKIGWSIGDVETLDAEFHQSLTWIKENDISDMDLDLTFSVNEEVFGQVTERELKANGKNIPVSEKNKKEYIERMVKWRLERGVTEQTESLIRGFQEVLDPRLVSIFDARELELVLAGTVEIDIYDWRKNTEYRSGYHDQHEAIQWFWMAIEKFNNERRLRLLQFVTGTSSIPYEGFQALRGSNGPRKFCIEKWGRITSLPRAHTCFNRLDLPPYTSPEMLFEKLVTAVEETSTFGIE